jgi:hypothetical protein
MGEARSLIIFFLIMIILPVPLVGCVNQAPSTDKLNSDTYVFIEHYDVTHETIIESSYTGFPMISSTDPMGNGYAFNESTGSLSYFSNFIKDNASTVAVLGETDGTDGLHNRKIYRMYNFDKIPGEAGDIQLLEISDNGTVSLRYENVSIMLKPGDEWVNTTSDVTFVNMTIYRINSTKTNVATVKLNTTTVDRIKNYGILQRSGLRGGLGMI